MDIITDFPARLFPHNRAQLEVLLSIERKKNIKLQKDINEISQKIEMLEKENSELRTQLFQPCQCMEL